MGLSPNLLHVHALPLRGPGTTQDQGIAGVGTLAPRLHRAGNTDAPTEVPWGEAFEHALSFIAVAMQKDGYVVRDGGTFGDDSDSYCYRVHHTAEPLFNAGAVNSLLRAGAAAQQGTGVSIVRLCHARRDH